MMKTVIFIGYTLMQWLFLTFLLSLQACGTFRKQALRSISPVFTQSGDLLMRENNWDLFVRAAPGNVKFMEMLSLQDPDNLELKAATVKAFAGLAFADAETRYLAETVAGEEGKYWKNQAISLYTRAFDYGLEYLEKKDISRQDLLTLNDQSLQGKIAQKLNHDDLMGVLYTAQAWGSLLNLQKDNVALVAQVPKVKLLFDWVCSKKPDIDQGVCDIFYAQYEAARPRMLGGNPEKAEKLFQNAIIKHPKNLLVRLGYIQHMIMPQMDLEKYEIQARILRKEFQKWGELNRDSLVNESDYRDVADLNLFNAIAQKRFEAIEKNKNKIF
jgi:hypothetical protein